MLVIRPVLIFKAMSPLWMSETCFCDIEVSSFFLNLLTLKRQQEDDVYKHCEREKKSLPSLVKYFFCVIVCVRQGLQVLELQNVIESELSIKQIFTSLYLYLYYILSFPLKFSCCQLTFCDIKYIHMKEKKREDTLRLKYKWHLCYVLLLEVS